MTNLLRKTKDKLEAMAEKLGLSTDGTKADIAARIEGSDADPKKAKPHNWRELARKEKDATDRAALEKRLKKRGSYRGSPH